MGKLQLSPPGRAVRLLTFPDKTKKFLISEIKIHQVTVETVEYEGEDKIITVFYSLQLITPIFFTFSRDGTN